MLTDWWLWVVAAFSGSRRSAWRQTDWDKLFVIWATRECSSVAWVIWNCSVWRAASALRVGERYDWFSASSGSDTLVAIKYRRYRSPDKWVGVYILCGDRLEELSRIQLTSPFKLLLLAHRLLVSNLGNDKKSDSVIEFKISRARL